MRVHGTATAAALRPSRLNFVGYCIYCCKPGCASAECIAYHARSVWEVCPRCGGSEYVDGHIDPETACGRCDCTGGLTETTPAGVAASAATVVEFPRAAGQTVYECWPHDGGAPTRWVR